MLLAKAHGVGSLSLGHFEAAEMKLVEYVGCRCQDLSSLVRIARIFCIRNNEGWHPNFLVAGPVSPTPRAPYSLRNTVKVG